MRKHPPEVIELIRANYPLGGWKLCRAMLLNIGHSLTQGQITGIASFREIRQKPKTAAKPVRRRVSHQHEGDWYISEEEIYRRAARLRQERSPSVWNDCRFSDRPHRPPRSHERASQERQLMGTNFYAILNECPHCKRHERLHIGKSAVGWEFHFQGFRESDADPRIVSVADWRKFLVSKTIRNEYGEDISHEEFWEWVEATRARGGRKSTQYMLNDPHDRSYAVKRCWVDDEGWSFSDGDFS